jgi:sugar phosphate isomerase/epimerase
MKLSLFSVSYAGFWAQDRLELDEFLRHAAELGYDAVMIAGKRPHLSPLDSSPERIARLWAILSETGLECSAIGGYTDFAGGGAAEVPYLEMQIAYVESLARIARQLGAGIVRVFTAYESATTSFTPLWDRTVKAIQECCNRAAAHNVIIAVQNHHDLAVHSDALLEFLNDVDRPNCKLGFDAWSPALRGEPLYETAKRMAPHTICTTNADYVKLPRYHYQPALVNYQPATPDAVRAVPFGTGFIDYEAFFKGLRDGGFDGIATYEMCSPIRGGGSRENLDSCAAGYMKWMKERGLTFRRDRRQDERPE